MRYSTVQVQVHNIDGTKAFSRHAVVRQAFCSNIYQPRWRGMLADSQRSIGQHFSYQQGSLEESEQWKILRMTSTRQACTRMATRRSEKSLGWKHGSFSNSSDIHFIVMANKDLNCRSLHLCLWTCFIVQHRKCPWTNVRRHRKVYFCHHRWRGQRRRCSELETLLLRSERRIFKPPSDSGPGAAMPPPPGQAGQRHIQHEGPEVRGERKGKISHQRCRPHFGHDGWQPGLGSWIRSPKVKLQNWLQRACCLFSANPSSSVEFSGHHSAKFPDRWSKISSSRWISKAFLVLTYVSFEVVRKYKETFASSRWFFWSWYKQTTNLQLEKTVNKSIL